jgi:hypothetical protein
MPASEIFSVFPFSDYTYSHTGIYMRHSDDLLSNGSESILSYGGVAGAENETVAPAAGSFHDQDDHRRNDHYNSLSYKKGQKWD